MNNKLSTFSDGTVTLSGFIFLTDMQPDESELCLVILKKGYLSAGCWSKSELYPQGIFRQGHGGFVEVTDVIAWLPVERTSINLNRMCWKEKYHPIASFLDCFTVYARDANPQLIIQYTGGAEEAVLIYLNVITGEYDGDTNDVRKTLEAWFNENKEELVADYYSGSYNVLPNW